MLTRALCNWLARMSRAGRALFMNIQPAGLHSMWYSQIEANYREAFRVAREAGNAQPDIPVVMFFDEVDSIGASRGGWGMPVDDRVQTALMAELDGLERARQHSRGGGDQPTHGDGFGVDPAGPLRGRGDRDSTPRT